MARTTRELTDARWAKRYLRRRGIRAVIPPKSDQPLQPSFDKAAYRQRSHVERTVNRLKGWRRVATGMRGAR